MECWVSCVVNMEWIVGVVPWMWWKGVLLEMVVSVYIGYCLIGDIVLYLLILNGCVGMKCFLILCIGGFV